MYRSRFAQASEQITRLDTVVDDGLRRLTIGKGDGVDSKRPWISAGLVPNQLGSMPLTLETLDEYRDWLVKFASQEPFTQVWANATRTTSGVRRITATYYNVNPGAIDTDYAEFHTDGSGFAATPMRWSTQHSSEPVLFDARLIDRVVALLRMLADHAVNRAGAYGEAVVEVRVHAPVDLMLASSRAANEGWEMRGPDTNNTLKGDEVSRHTLSLDDLTGSQSRLLAASRLVLTDLFQAFGSPEVRQITPDGGLRIRHWSSSEHQSLRRWADANGVEVTAETRPEPM